MKTSWFVPMAQNLMMVTVMVTFWTGTASLSPAAGLGVTPAEKFAVADGFEIELLYEVPADQQGSWVAMTVDPKGRLITSDQYGLLYRLDVSVSPPKVEKLAVDFGAAQGLLCAFDALYANVNSRDRDSGVYRLTDTDGDDQYDKVEHIIEMNGGSEHGPHAMILTPDQKRILMIAGNNTSLPEYDRSRVPEVWGEDHLLGRMPDARGHNANRLAPGGFVMSFDAEGKDRELVAIGFRNPYDIALNRDGELFTYDADMEWDVGTPWYRPTRVNHVVSGADFGWRNGTGKWPAYYPDSFGAAVNIGPGSPTGICFGYGASFPEKYENALFISDWSYGNIHAVFLEPDGSSYGGNFETFATAAPLPVTDLAVHPDGNLYFTVGGRRTQSGLYRIVYRGDASTAESAAEPAAETTTPPAAAARRTRRRLEGLHLSPLPESEVANVVAELDHEDRGIRSAARIALEHAGADVVHSVVDQADSVDQKIQVAIALARVGDETHRGQANRLLDGLDWTQLSSRQQVDSLRARSLVAMRLGKPSEEEKATLRDAYSRHFPTGDGSIDRELAQWLVYLEDPSATGRVVAAMRTAPSQEDQIHYAMTLRDAKAGWKPKLRERYFQWFNDIADARGGMSFGGFLANIKDAAIENLSVDEKKRLANVLAAPKSDDISTTASRQLVQQWTVESLEKALDAIPEKADYENGKTVFAEAQCYKCHRMGLQGGILGPDLTSAGGKYGVRDLLVSMVHPEKEISDQYAATQFLTDDGKVVVGRVINMSGDQLRVMTNMLDPSKLTTIKNDQILQTQEAKASMMPSGLLDVFTAEEIRDLLAYLRAGGKASHQIFASVNAEPAEEDADKQWLVFDGSPSLPGGNQHVVLISGDHEYRSEEALPQLGKILSQNLGFKCTVLFPIHPETGIIDPEYIENIPGLEAIQTADVVVFGLRFRNLPDDQMQMILDYVDAGRPMVALRTSTHPFAVPEGRKFHSYSWDTKRGRMTRWPAASVNSFLEKPGSAITVITNTSRLAASSRIPTIRSRRASKMATSGARRMSTA